MSDGFGHACRPFCLSLPGVNESLAYFLSDVFNYLVISTGKKCVSSNIFSSLVGKFLAFSAGYREKIEESFCLAEESSTKFLLGPISPVRYLKIEISLPRKAWGGGEAGVNAYRPFR